jgi:hypothetical protein
MPTDTKRANRQIGTASSAGSSALVPPPALQAEQQEQDGVQDLVDHAPEGIDVLARASLIAKRRPALPIRPATTTAIGPDTWIQNDSE